MAMIRSPGAGHFDTPVQVVMELPIAGPDPEYEHSRPPPDELKQDSLHEITSLSQARESSVGALPAPMLCPSAPSAATRPARTRRSCPVVWRNAQVDSHSNEGSGPRSRGASARDLAETANRRGRNPGLLRRTRFWHEGLVRRPDAGIAPLTRQNHD